MSESSDHIVVNPIPSLQWLSAHIVARDIRMRMEPIFYQECENLISVDECLDQIRNLVSNWRPGFSLLDLPSNLLTLLLKALKRAGCNYMFHIATFFPEVKLPSLHLKKCDRLAERVISRARRVVMCQELGPEGRYRAMQALSKAAGMPFSMITFPCAGDPADARYIDLIPAFHMITKLRSHIWKEFAHHFSMALRHLTALKDLKFTVRDCSCLNHVHEAFESLSCLKNLKKLDVRLPLLSVDPTQLAERFLLALPPTWPSFKSLRSFSICEKLISVNLADQEPFLTLKSRCPNLTSIAEPLPENCILTNISSATLSIDVDNAFHATEHLVQLSRALPELDYLSLKIRAPSTNLSSLSSLKTLNLTFKDVGEDWEGPLVSHWPSKLEDLWIEFTSAAPDHLLQNIFDKFPMSIPLKTLSFGWHTAPSASLISKILSTQTGLKSLSIAKFGRIVRPPLFYSHGMLRSLSGDDRSFLPVIAPQLTSLRALLDTQCPSLAPLCGCPNIRLLDLQIASGAQPSAASLASISSLIHLKELEIRGNCQSMDLNTLIRVGANWNFLQTLVVTNFWLVPPEKPLAITSALPLLSKLKLSDLSNAFDLSQLSHSKLRELKLTYLNERFSLRLDGSNFLSVEDLSVTGRFSTASICGFPALRRLNVTQREDSICDRIQFEDCDKLSSVVLTGEFSDVDVKRNVVVTRI